MWEYLAPELLKSLGPQQIGRAPKAETESVSVTYKVLSVARRTRHIRAGYSVKCGSDGAALRAARTLLERSAAVEVWRSNQCVAHLGVEARHLEPDAQAPDG